MSTGKQPDEAVKIIRHLKGFEPKVAAQLERETGLLVGGTGPDAVLLVSMQVGRGRLQRPAETTGGRDRARKGGWVHMKGVKRCK